VSQQSGQIIDIWCNIFTTEGTELYYNSQAQDVAAQVFGMEDMYDPSQGMPADDFVEKMDRNGIDKVLLPALKFGNPDGGMEIDVPHEMVRDLVETHPARFEGVAGINPRKGMDAVALLDEYVTDHGFVGAVLEPYGWDLPLNHRKLYPFYAKCAELDVPVMMQVGHSAMRMPSEHGKPILLDDLALDFPDLDIIGCHTGWPWSQELEAMAWKHPNVYMGATAHAPKYWEENVTNFIRTRGQDKVVFGTDYPVLDYPETIAQLDDLDLDPAVERKLLSENARELFDL
jgi:predicted TIM-barrel fold metal-dependent hydrolase